MARTGVVIHGLRELQAKLNELGREIGPRILPGSLKKAGEMVLDEMQSRVPQETGGLRNSLQLEVDGDKSVSIGATKDGWYWYFVEFGTRRHRIPKARRRRKAKPLLIGPETIRASAEHPGARAKPFVRPAWDAKRREIVLLCRDDIERAAVQ